MRPSEKMEDKFCEIEEQTVRYWEMGAEDAPTVVLLHGIGAAVESWGTLPIILSAKFHVIALDFPGFGRSEKSDIAYSPALLLQLFDGFCRQKDLKDLILIGHSLGGGVALGYATTEPSNVRRLVALAPGGLGDVSPWFRFLASPFAEKFLLPFVGNDWIGPQVFRFFYGRKLSRDALEQLAAHWDDRGVFRTFVGVMQSAGKEQRGRLIEGLSQIKCPVLVIWGVNDLILNASHAKVAKAKIPNCQIVLISGAGHCAHTENPDIVNPIIERFLSA
jgi:pimeloyl-ACP methyl ester carboxylesterase